jgi:asparagine synthase (glutamine-hydrolysing)
MAIFAALVQPVGRPPDPALDGRLAASVAFIGPAQTFASPDGALRVALAGRQASFATSAGVSVAASGRLDDRADLERMLGLNPTASVAELLLAAYAGWGDDLVQHIIGDFAFALWDERSRRLLAATDQFGARPIHYGLAGERLIVSTAIGPVRDSGLVDTGVNETFVADYLAIGVNLDVESTIHKGVRRLPPAGRLGWAGGVARIDSYWRIPTCEAPLGLTSRAAYVGAFRELFFRAVADRLPATGPISLQLSGGMDSTAIAAAMREILGGEAAAARIRAHTVVYRGYPEAEGHFAGLAADRMGIPRQSWVVEAQALAEAPARSRRAGPQPDGPRELLPENSIVELAAASGAVHFNGLGGDVLLWPSPVSPLDALRSGAWAPGAVLDHVRLFGAAPDAGLRATARRWVRRPARRSAPGWLSPELARRTGLEDRLADLALDRREGPALFHGPFWSRLASRGDPGNSGLDLPVVRPFLDVRLVELAARLPVPMLRGKRILREAMRPYLPEEVVTRPKTPLGLVAPYVQSQPQVVARQLALVDRTPQLEDFVDVPKLRSAIQAPHALEAGALLRAEGLACWLADR